MLLHTVLASWVSPDTPNPEVLGITQDSRNVRPGFLFLAFKGARTDGRLYIKQAINLGAIAIAYEQEETSPLEINHDAHVTYIPIPHLSQHIAAIAEAFYGKVDPNIHITAVTGTNGKTTIAYELAQAYTLLNHKAAYIGTLGHGHVQDLRKLLNTTPDPLALQALFHEYQKEQYKQVCMEVSSHALAEDRTHNLSFEQAIFTNLTEDHLDFHHTMDAYAEAKSLLFARPELQYAIINGDDPYASRMIEAVRNPKCKIIRYGFKPEYDFYVSKWATTLTGSELEIVCRDWSMSCTTPLYGLFNIYNTLAICISLYSSGFKKEEIQQVLPHLKAPCGRMEILSTSPTVLVDFAHTPDALDNVLKTLAPLKKGRLIVVFGCGGDRDKEKRPLMGKVVHDYADIMIVTSDNPRTEDPQTIIQEIIQPLPKTEKVRTVIDRKEAIHQALQLADEKDIVLVAGKGHESTQEINHRFFTFSDHAVIREYL